jgi:aromatic ring hydroxylase
MNATRPQPITAPGARRGAQFLARLRESPPNLWYRGEQVKDVTTHPA